MENERDNRKNNFLLFEKCLKIYSFFAFAIKVCKNIHYDPKKFLTNIDFNIVDADFYV